MNATSGAGFEVQFEDKAISLAIPDDGVCSNGWAIKPLASPRVSLYYYWSSVLLMALIQLDFKAASGYV